LLLDVYRVRTEELNKAHVGAYIGGSKHEI
jgi:hypothetical protein